MLSKPSTFFIALVLLPSCSQLPRTPQAPSDTYTVGHTAQFADAIAQLATAPNQQVLVVFDIDDTLLESDSFFGGDTWYNWQTGKPVTTQNNTEVTINPDEQLNCLFAQLDIFFTLGNFHTPEPNAPEMVAELQRQYHTLVLTSRSPNARGGTERTLANAGYDFAAAHLLADDLALNYSLNDGKRTAAVSYANGIVMSTGLNKGVVLKDLLTRLGKNYRQIFFLDDGSKNIANMSNAWAGSNTGVYTFLYTHVDKTVSGEKIQQANDAKKALDTFIKTAFPGRYEAFTLGDCD